MDQSQILAMLDSGDQQWSNRKYEHAFSEYEEALPLVVAGTIIDKRSKSIGNMMGWTGGFLSGGIGLEDILIIPAISKGVAHLFGVDDGFTNHVIAEICLRELDCILNSEILLQQVDRDTVLQRFALLFRSAQPISAGEQVKGYYLPELSLANALDDPDVLHAAYAYLLRVIKEDSIENNDWCFLLYIYLKKIKDDSELFKNLSENWGPDDSGENSNQNESESKQTSKNSSDTREHWCKILGVENTATPGEIKRAYRDLMKKYHPDKFANCAPEFIEVAHRKTKEINEAYQKLLQEDEY
jgi:hypothetical protein